MGATCPQYYSRKYFQNHSKQIESVILNKVKDLRFFVSLRMTSYTAQSKKLYNTSVRSLIDQVLKGDPEAVTDFYKSNSPKILKYLIKYLPSREDAEDLTNDVFFEAIDSLQFLTKEDNLQAWLYKIAHNKMVDYYRKRKIKSLLLSQIPYLEIIDKEVHQPDFQFEKDRVRDKIEKTLISLSEKYQKVLRLHYEEGISVKDIATRLDMSFKATESLLFRARKQFQLVYERK